ncbi:DUF4175 domain-containing protein [Mycolicibacterium grossiae]|uniref:DUF4175 domain-containing protein n=1 Tax=Mycolicibacterium grossiae TaxID=1552759 RepID=UPI0011F0D5DE|nr:DUF4175 domain-containing protein [Mycolicibacterium grossiae]QEM43845.1 DUF4175 domain-containing protein [Mycolicibacterium grossiae]
MTASDTTGPTPEDGRNDVHPNNDVHPHNDVHPTDGQPNDGLHPTDGQPNDGARPNDVHPNYTGPLRVPTPPPAEAAPAEHPSGPFRPVEQHDEGPWSGGFAPPPVIPRQRPVRATPRLPLRAMAIGAAVVLVVGGLGWWALSASDGAAPPGEPAPTTAAPSEADARATLRGLLPPGYSDAACEAVSTPKGAVAKFGCERNADPGGPPLATYTLLPDDAAVTRAFDDVVKASTVVTCPGNIQSPGPWRRNATPDVVAGTLFCGYQRDLPTVAWTNDAERVVSAVRGDATGPNLEQLYRWWSSHS